MSISTKEHIEKVCAAAVALIGAGDGGDSVRALLDAIGAAMTHSYAEGVADAQEAHRNALKSVVASIDGSLH